MSTKHVVAKKQFGQNFLQDVQVLQTIIEAMPATPNVVAEIGPGLGDLTKYLVDVKSVNAFEVDTDLCKHLQTHFIDAITTNRLTLNCGDVLERWESSLLDEPYDLVANLPYYIATAIILKALADPQCQNLLVMIQREVAEKFAAAPGESDFGSLSVIAQSVADCEIITIVPPEAFHPAPKVDSAVIRMRKRADRSDPAFEQFLRQAFAQPRKTLLKNLSGHHQKMALHQAFETLDLSATIRPHQLTPTDFHQLFVALH